MACALDSAGYKWPWTLCNLTVNLIRQIETRIVRLCADLFNRVGRKRKRREEKKGRGGERERSIASLSYPILNVRGAAYGQGRVGTRFHTCTTDIFLGGNFHAIARKVNYRISRTGTRTCDVSRRSQCTLRRLGCSRKSSRMPFLDTRER